MDSVRGQLLIAGPALVDPNFWRTVVLVVEHSDEGALGLVLNRPSETTVSDASEELGELVESDELLFIGGPVQPSAVIVLAQFEDPSDAALMPLPSEETTPPVMKMNRVMDLQCIATRRAVTWETRGRALLG